MPLHLLGTSECPHTIPSSSMSLIQTASKHAFTPCITAAGAGVLWWNRCIHACHCAVLGWMGRLLENTWVLLGRCSQLDVSESSMLLTWTVECVDRFCGASVWVRRWQDCGSWLWHTLGRMLLCMCQERQSWVGAWPQGYVPPLLFHLSSHWRRNVSVVSFLSLSGPSQDILSAMVY